MFTLFMFRFFYDLIVIILMPLILVRLFVRGYKAPAYRKRISERFGFYRFPKFFKTEITTIWVHAVSVGEVFAAQPLIRELEKLYPHYQIFITTMTPTGSDQVRRLFGERVFHSYLPYDSSLILSRFIRRMDPKLLIIMETELWPNLIAVTGRMGAKILLANARLSEKSASGYSKFRSVTKRVLGQIDLIGAQSEYDSERLIKLGAKPEKIVVTGNLKYHVNISIEDQSNRSLFDELKASARPIVIAASTRDGEEEKLLVTIKAVLRKFSKVLFIVVPRHPERFDKVFSDLKKSRLICARRSSIANLGDDVQVLIGDSLGEMHSYYAVSHIAFVGGSLVNTGCHNVLEPAAMSLPILVGPSQYNFAQICERLETAGGLLTVRDESELAQEIINLLENKSKRMKMGSIAKEGISANQKALPMLVRMIEDVLFTD